MNTRRILSSICLLSVAALGFVFLLLPAFSQEQVSSKVPVVVQDAQTRTRQVAPVPYTPPPWFSALPVASSSPSADDSGRMQNFRNLEADYQRRHAALKTKEAQLAHLENLVAQTRKERDEQKKGTIAAAKELSNALEDYRRDLEKADQASVSPLPSPGPIFPSTPQMGIPMFIPAPPPPSSYPDSSDVLIQKFDQLSKRLEAIESKLNSQHKSK